MSRTFKVGIFVVLVIVLVLTRHAMSWQTPPPERPLTAAELKQEEAKMKAAESQKRAENIKWEKIKYQQAKKKVRDDNGSPVPSEDDFSDRWFTTTSSGRAGSGAALKQGEKPQQYGPAPP